MRFLGWENRGIDIKINIVGVQVFKLYRFFLFSQILGQSVVAILDLTSLRTNIVQLITFSASETVNA